MIKIGDVVFHKTFWALDQKDNARKVTLTPQFISLIESKKGPYGTDYNRPVSDHSETVDILNEKGVTYTIELTRIFTTEKGARQSVKDRRKLKELDDSFDALPDQDAFIKIIIKTQLDLSVLDTKTSRIMKNWLNTPTTK